MKLHKTSHTNYKEKNYLIFLEFKPFLLQYQEPLLSDSSADGTVSVTGVDWKCFPLQLQYLKLTPFLLNVISRSSCLWLSPCCRLYHEFIVCSRIHCSPSGLSSAYIQLAFSTSGISSCGNFFILSVCLYITYF